MRKIKKFDVYSDPGHCWVKVRFRTLVDLNIYQNISPFSYSRGEYVYLEEDCDVPVLQNALRARDIEPKWICHHTNKSSKIRSYSPYFFGEKG